MAVRDERPCLIHGVTGSGKTEVYMELIKSVLREGKQAIVLIPEIALTFQTVLRFYNHFGERVSILNSRMSPGERSDQFGTGKTRTFGCHDRTEICIVHTFSKFRCYHH